MSEKYVIGGVAVILVLTLAVAAALEGKTSALDDCDAYGEIHWKGDVYDCTKQGE